MLWKCVLLLLSFVPMVSCRSRIRSRLSLWIDEDQVEKLIGVAMEIPIINYGEVIQLVHEPELSKSIIIPSDVDTVNLTWQAGDEMFTYRFENLTSLDTNLLYNPLLSIPENGVIPRGPTVFQMSIPCTGKEEGVALLVLGLKIYNGHSVPVEGTPISFTLRKKCLMFATALCGSRCQNGGTCNEKGVCECSQGFTGKYCAIALCNPVCKNNGTCISPEVCRCPAGYSGQHCEKEVCGKPCQNGGRCLPEGYCYCYESFYGDHCEYSYCHPECKNGKCKRPNTCECYQGYTGPRCEQSTECHQPCNNGVCVGPNKCRCKAGFSGPLCERVVGPDTDRPRRSRTIKNKEQRRRKSKKKKVRRKRRKGKKDLEKKLLKTEKRIMKIITRKLKELDITKEDRRNVRNLLRETRLRTLSLRERNFLTKILTKERNKLTNKERQKLRRFKKLLKLFRRRSAKPKKRRLFV